MGRDKLFLEVGGVPLFERVYGVLNELFNDLIVVANKPSWFRSYRVRVYPDLISNKGALGGLYTGLKYACSDSVFCFASDMPFLNPPLIRYMIGKENEGDVIIPKTSDGLQPLHAIYSKRCLEAMENLISRTNLKIVDFFIELNVIYVSEREISGFDPELTSFLNVNTEDDLRRAEAMISQDLIGER